jgi:hypothetical protein
MQAGEGVVTVPVRPERETLEATIREALREAAGTGVVRWADLQPEIARLAALAAAREETT